MASRALMVFSFAQIREQGVAAYDSLHKLPRYPRVLNDTQTQAVASYISDGTLPLQSKIIMMRGIYIVAMRSRINVTGVMECSTGVFEGDILPNEEVLK